MAEALDAQPSPNATSLDYQEEIFHPALTDPLIARGVFEISPDGSLIRHQKEPEIETVRIGENFIFMRRESDGGGSNILPIPSELEFLFTSLRVIVGQADQAALKTYDHELLATPSGWSLALQPVAAAETRDRIVVEGCGQTVEAIELQFGDSDRRRISFQKPSP